MTTTLVAFTAATVAAAIATPVIRNLAHRWGAVDHALSSRKIHGRPIPRLGGIAIVLGFYAPLLALLFVHSDVGDQFWAQRSRALGLLGGGLVIAALGIYDDLKGANARCKFVVQFGVAALMYAVGFRIDQIANPFGPPIDLGLLALPFTMLWIAGVINALNLIDGLDGLAGGVAFFAVATIFVIAVLQGRPLTALFAAALAGAVLGFLFYNFNPATIFMGDTGSMFLGFVLSVTAIRANETSSTAVALVVPCIALGIPIADTLLAMARRAARGAPLFSADRGHIHHRLLDLGLTQKQAVILIYGASILLGASALALTYASSSQALYFLVGLAGFAYLALRKLGYIKIAGPQQVQQLFDDRKRNLQMRAAIRCVADALRVARTEREVWHATRLAGRAVGASAIALRLGDSDGADHDFADGFEDAGPELFRARYSILGERPGNDHLDVGWLDGRRKIDRDTEIAIELLCDHVSSALERVQVADEPGLFAKVAGLRG